MIQTGLKKLDQYLGGGIKGGTIIDIYGASGTGKTQLAMQISLNSLQNNGEVFFLDTTGNFRPERMLEIINTNCMNSNLLNKVKVVRITNTTEQNQHLSKISNSENLSLIVVDNVTELFSFEYSRKEQTLEKQISFMRHMHNLSYIAIQKQVPIIVTNIIRKKDDLEYENLEQAIKIFTHVKIRLSKTHDEFTGRIFPSFLRDRDFSYLITSRGLIDSSEAI